MRGEATTAGGRGAGGGWSLRLEGIWFPAAGHAIAFLLKPLLPSLPQPWKDSSAAAIAASGLLRLGQLTGSANYTDAGAALVEALADGYMGWQGPKPLESILREGTFNAPKGSHSTGLIWGDWYFLDALSTLLPIANATCP